MEYRRLGNSDLRVSSIVLGTAFRGGLVEEMPQVIERALELGINIFDTGGYVRHGVVTEEVVGQVVKERRQDVVLAVKQDPPLTHDLETRLARLQTDYIDLLEQYRALIDTLGQIGRQRGKSVAQVAINWMLCQDIAMPIIGPDTVAHLEENCGAVG